MIKKVEALKWLKQLMEQTTIKFPKIEHPQKIRKNDKWKNGETLKMRRLSELCAAKKQKKVQFVQLCNRSQGMQGHILSVRRESFARAEEIA